MMHGELDSFHRGLKAKVEELHAANAVLEARLAKAREKIRVQGEQYMEMYQLNSDARTRLAKTETALKDLHDILYEREDEGHTLGIIDKALQPADSAPAVCKHGRGPLCPHCATEKAPTVTWTEPPPDSAPAVEPCKWCGQPVTEQIERPVDYCVHDKLAKKHYPLCRYLTSGGPCNCPGDYNDS